MTFTTIRGTGGAADTFAGSNGVDTLAFVNQANAFLLYGAQSTDNVTVANAFNGAIGGSLNGGDGNDTYNLAGPAGTTIFASGSLQGNAGNDILTTGLASNSTIQGGQGIDTITVAGANISSINGNKGLDIISITAASTNSTIRGGQGDDAITIGGNLTSTNVYGDEGSDNIGVTVTAAYATSTVFGGNGDDVITTNGAFTANLSGDAGNDNLTGAGGNDNLFGGEGNDTITGGVGADIISAGGGTDRAAYALTGDTVTGTVTLGAGGTNISTTADIISGLGVGDTISVGTSATIDFTNGGTTTTYAVATTAITVGAANVARLVRGTYNATTGLFTGNNTATDIDYLVQWSTAGGGAGSINSTILNDVGVLSALNANASGVASLNNILTLA